VKNGKNVPLYFQKIIFHLSNFHFLYFMGAFIEVIVTPNASKNIILPFAQLPLRVRLTSSPVNCKANNSLVKILAKTLSVPQSSIRIVRGKTSRKKCVEIMHLQQETVEERLRMAKN
jgi:uncharacterized protein (TIGR00251 family)